MDRFLETPVELIEKQVWANAIAPLHINQLVLPGMVERGIGGRDQHLFGVGLRRPHPGARRRGLGLGYGMSKAAFHRVAGQLATELEPTGVRFFNVQPNLIATERIAADMAEFGIDNVGAPADVVAAVVVWLVTDPEAAEWNGRNIEAQFFCHERNLLPGWGGPIPNEAPIRYDLSGKVLEDLETALRAGLGTQG